MFTCYVSELTRRDFFDHLGGRVTSVDNLSGPQGQVLRGLSPEQVSLDAESRASAGGKEQLRARVRRPPVRAGVHQTG